VITVAAD